MSFMCIHDLDYSYRMFTKNLYPNDRSKINVFFDIFVPDENRFFEEHHLFDNLWRETILLKYLNDDRV